MTFKLTDIHAHLDRYPPAELPMVLDAARRAGLAWIVTAGMDFESSRQALDLARTHERVLASVGVHPWIAAGGLPERLPETLRGLAAREPAVAIGEVGIDLVGNAFTGQSYRDAPVLRRVQEEGLRVQIGVACEVDLPLVIHCRGAYGLLLEILGEEKAYRVGGAVHNFDADLATARRLLDMGFLLSFGGAVTYPDAHALHGLIRCLPLDGILLETDSPYMPLHQEKSARNEPARVAEVVQALARHGGVDVDRLIEATFVNFTRLLRLGQASP